MADLPESSSIADPSNPYAYHYVDDLLSFIEFCDGSYQTPYAYHYDINTLGSYFVELKDGSILSATVGSPYTLLKRSFESSEQIENAINSNLNCYQFTSSEVSPGGYGWESWDDDFHEHGGACFNWDEDFPELGGICFNYDEDFPELGGICFNYDEDFPQLKETDPKPTGEGDKKGVEVSEEQGSCVSSSGSASLCMDRIREELSCAICLELCVEPSTTSCGHSFCGECLRSAADICGTRCPKCRQVISNVRSLSVNTGLWNTIQLLFPKEVEGRKAAGALNGGEAERQSSVRIASHSRSRTASSARSQSSVNFRTRRELPSQEVDDAAAAALAWLLQREDFM